MKISVIVTCYNLEKYISRAIYSCLDQTISEENYEIIVVDDYSTDNSWNVIQSVGDLGGRIVSVRHSENKGVGEASNTALSVAKGKYVVKVDGDDFINKNFLFAMSQILDYNEEIGFVYGDHLIVDENNKRQYSINTLDKLLDNGAGVMFRTKNVNSLGGYATKYKTRDDYDLITRYIKNFDGYYLKLPYYRYFQRNGSLSKNAAQRELEKNEIDKNNN